MPDNPYQPANDDARLAGMDLLLVAAEHAPLPTNASVVAAIHFATAIAAMIWGCVFWRSIKKRQMSVYSLLIPTDKDVYPTARDAHFAASITSRLTSPIFFTDSQPRSK